MDDNSYGSKTFLLYTQGEIIQISIDMPKDNMELLFTK